MILGGTTEATALARAVAEAQIDAVVSLAGRVARPARQPLPQRIGGFGGVAGLCDYIRSKGITHLIDATHPFAAQMSAHAVAAARAEALPLIALTRPPWTERAGDRWTRVPDMETAARALPDAPATVLLAIGRLNLDVFASAPGHRYILRLIDAPDAPLPLPRTEVILARGPFTEPDDRALMIAHDVDVVVSKNAGGTAAVAKIDAARALGLPVIMIDRPVLPPRPEAHDVGDVLRWVAHCGTDRGV